MTAVAPSSPEPAAGWAALLHAGPLDPARQADLSFERDMGFTPDFASVSAHPADFIRQQLDHLSPAELDPLRTMIDREISERTEQLQAGADGLQDAGPNPAHQALGRAELALLRAECGQLRTLSQWIDAAIAGKADGSPPAQWSGAALHAGAWDLHRVQAHLASLLVDERQARLDLETGSTTESRRMAATRIEVAATTVDGAVTAAEIATLHRACDSLEAGVMTAWRSAGSAPPAQQFAAVCGAQLLSVRALDALLLVRDLAHRYPAPSPGQSLPIGATGLARDAMPPAPDLGVAVGRAAMHDQVLQQYPRLVAIGQALQALNAQARSDPDTAARIGPAVMAAARAFDTLNGVYDGYTRGVQVALGQDNNASPLLFDYGMRRQLTDMPPWNPELAGAVSHEMDRIRAAFDDADRHLPGAAATLEQAIEAAGAVPGHEGLGTLHGALTELHAALPTAPEAVPRVLPRVDDLPTAAVAHAAQAFTVANPDSPEAEQRALAAENLLDLDPAPDARPAAQRLFATLGPAGLPIASDG